VDHAGMNALMPLPGIMDARVLVVEREFDAAERVLRDLEQLQLESSGSEEGKNL